MTKLFSSMMNVRANTSCCISALVCNLLDAIVLVAVVLCVLVRIMVPIA